LRDIVLANPSLAPLWPQIEARLQAIMQARTGLGRGQPVRVAPPLPREMPLPIGPLPVTPPPPVREPVWTPPVEPVPPPPSRRELGGTPPVEPVPLPSLQRKTRRQPILLPAPERPPYYEVPPEEALRVLQRLGVV
jgi:hypothetical protein